jgi:hypothetical protein
MARNRVIRYADCREWRPGRLAWDTPCQACLLLYTEPRGGRGAIISGTITYCPRLRITITSKFGRSGMGEVYGAVDKKFGRDAALNTP